MPECTGHARNALAMPEMHWPWPEYRDINNFLAFTMGFWLLEL
jgi:hypothetical protein